MAVPAAAQGPARTPQFEVTSVRPCPGQAEPIPRRGGEGRESSPDRLHRECQTLHSLIWWAYVQFADGRFNPLAADLSIVSGGPPWVNSDLYEIDAKAETPQSWGTLNGPMLRSLLEERFHLKIRRVTKEIPVYALTIAKDGPHLRAPKTDCVSIDPQHPDKAMQPAEPSKGLPAVCGFSRLTTKGWEAFSVTMDQFATLLSLEVDRKVINRTGLPGKFDIRLDMAFEDFIRGAPADDLGQPVSRPDQTALIRTAVEKLGLRMESSKGPDESLVIDEAQQPSQN
jgi:uncharacterized protein (TIGR03435 family)